MSIAILVLSVVSFFLAGCILVPEDDLFLPGLVCACTLAIAVLSIIMVAL